MSKARRLLEMFFSENNNLKINSSDENRYDNFKVELRNNGIKSIDYEKILEEIDKLDTDTDDKFKMAKYLVGTYDLVYLFKRKPNIIDKYKWIRRPLNKTDEYLIPNQLGGVFVYKFKGIENGKYVFQNTNPEWVNDKEKRLDKKDLSIVSYKMLNIPIRV